MRRVRDLGSGDTRVYLEFEVRRVLCRRCRASTLKDVAEELHLDWHAVKELDKEYMRIQLERIGIPGLKAIGIDEISIRKGGTPTASW